MYQLQSISTELVDHTNAAWNAQIAVCGEDIFISHYEMVMDWAKKYADGQGDDGCHVYGLVADGADYACAYLELSHAGKHLNEPWLKVLAVYIEPALDVNNQDANQEDLLDKITDILGYSLVESLRLTMGEHPSSKLKVYAKTDDHLGFFQAMAASARKSGQIPGLKVSTHGRWLVFEKL